MNLGREVRHSSSSSSSSFSDNCWFTVSCLWDDSVIRMWHCLMKNFLTEGSCVFLWKFDCVCLWFILRNPRNKGRNLWHGVLMMSVAGLFHWILIFTVNHSVRMLLMEWSCPTWPVKCWHQTLVLVSGVIHLTYYFLKFYELLIRGPVGMICRITFLS